VSLSSLLEEVRVVVMGEAVVVALAALEHLLF
jgi:hypothetical protein